MRKLIVLLVALAGCMKPGDYRRCLAMHRESYWTVDGNGYAYSTTRYVCDKTEAPPQ